MTAADLPEPKLARLMRSSPLRLAAGLSLIFGVATLLAGLASYILLTGALKDRLREDARQMAQALAATYQVAGLIDLHAQIATNVATTRDLANLYLFVDASGAIVFGNFSVSAPFSGPRDLVAGRDILLPRASGVAPGTGFSAYGLRVPAGWIMTARQTSALDAVQRIVLQSVALGLGLAVALAVAVALALAQRVERRIARLNAVLDRAAGGDLAERAIDPGGDDIGRIAASVNAMLDQLELTVESLRQVSSDVAHDLRTPISRLRTRLEPLALRDDLPADAARDIAAAVAESDQIVRIFNAVLRIAQIEGGDARPELVPLDLGHLLADLHDMLEPVADELGHVLACTRPETPVQVRGDRELLGQAITNLVENAFRHCPPPAAIRLTLAAEGGQAVLRVCDTGPGIPAGERAAVFRRFYRLEQSRNSEGSGLGLSLVAAIVRLHGGSAELADNPQQQPGTAPGLCVTIYLPLASR